MLKPIPPLDEVEAGGKAVDLADLLPLVFRGGSGLREG